MDEAISLRLCVSVSDGDTERLDAATQGLREELVERGFDPAPVPAQAPDRAKGDPTFWGALALAVLPTLLPKLVELIQDWSRRSSDRALTIEFKSADGTTESFEVRGGTDSLRSIVSQLRNRSSNP
jgi:hypothetical protein